MSFQRKSGGPCRYSVKYVCSCTDGKTGPYPVAVNVVISGHQVVEQLQFHLYGSPRSSVKFCPNCGAPVPEPKAILVLEELKHAPKT